MLYLRIQCFVSRALFIVNLVIFVLLMIFIYIVSGINYEVLLLCFGLCYPNEQVFRQVR